MAKIYLTDANGNSNSRNWSLGNGGSAFGSLTFAVSSAKDGVAGDGSSINVMCLDNSGKVLVGKNSTNSDTVGVEILPAGQVYVTANNTLPFYINRKGTSGNNEFARFSDDGATRGTIASSFQEELTISASGANSSGILFSQSNQVRPMKNGSTSNGTQDLGAGNGKWKDLYLSGGVYIGSNAAANYLDDYEEGTFTASPGNSVTLYSNYDLLHYTKIGRLVTITGQVRVNNSNGSSGFRITNFPFAHVANTEGEGHTFGACRLYNWAIPSGGYYVGCFMAPASTTCYVEYVRNNSYTVELPSDAGGYIMFGYTYTASA